MAVDFGQYAFALIFVIGLIGLFAWVLRRFGPAAQTPRRRGAQRHLEIIEIAAIDARRRLVLVRRDEVQHLVLIGGPNDLLLESAVPAPARFAETLEREPS